MTVIVLRLGHRKARDKRISTHCGLVARAFGADAIIYSGEDDEELVKSVSKLAQNWGGNFSVSYCEDWLAQIKEFLGNGGAVAHLTMYGLPFEKVISQIRKQVFAKTRGGNLKGARKNAPNNLLVVIGAEKVPTIVYQLSDWNIGVTNQPHSEVAALAVFLYSLFSGRKKDFTRAKVKIIPFARGKRVSRPHG